MKVILVGPADDRARLRASLNGSIRVVAELPTLPAAEAASIEADGILIATATNVGRIRSEPPASRVQQEPAYADDENDIAHEPLTPREIEVLELLAEGLPNKTIAERLGISSQTVKFHVASISSKLGAANRTDAVRRGVRRGLIAL